MESNPMMNSECFYEITRQGLIEEINQEILKKMNTENCSPHRAAEEIINDLNLKRKITEDYLRRFISWGMKSYVRKSARMDNDSDGN